MKTLLFLFFVLFSTSLFSQIIIDNTNERSNEIIYQADGSLRLFGMYYSINELAELDKIFLKADKEFKKLLQHPDMPKTVKELGRTSKQVFMYVFMAVDEKYYSIVVIWDMQQKNVMGTISREYDKKYEINKKPFNIILNEDRNQYYKKINKIDYNFKNK
jgi:hypothetical protein